DRNVTGVQTCALPISIVSVRGNVDAARSLTGIDNVYSDWREMVEHESLDLVVVASAVSLHKEMVQEIFATGIHVLCEKPMALNKIGRASCREGVGETV